MTRRDWPDQRIAAMSLAACRMTPGERRSAAAARAELKRSVELVLRAVRQNCDDTRAVTARTAEIEARLAATLRRLAAIARARDRPHDAARLERRVAQAERVAVAWRTRAPRA